MAFLQSYNSRYGTLREVSLILRNAAVFVALGSLSNAAMAQNEPAPVYRPNSFDCVPPPAERQIQLASATFARLEPAAGPVSNSKAAAILGGTASKLEQMQLSQSMATVNVVSRSSSANETMAPCARLEPAAPPLTLPVPENAILGSLSVAIKQSPFDRDWAAVNSKQSSRKMQQTLAATGARKAGDQAAQIEAVNRWVNRRIEFGEDRDIYGRADYWAPAAETLRRGIGDCEDFAIAKMAILSILGISRDKMRLVIARDLARNADHAVLVVTLAKGAVMLDNMTDRLLDARLPNDYRPIMSFSQNAKWVHGYAVQPAQTIRMASANPLPQPAASKLADVLTVTAEPEMPVLSMALLSVPLVLPSGLSAQV